MVICTQKCYREQDAKWTQSGLKDRDVHRSIRWLIIRDLTHSCWKLAPNAAAQSQDMMLAANVSANHWYIHICACHKLGFIVACQQNLSYLVYDLTGRGDSSGVISKQVANHLTAAGGSVSTFVSVKAPEILYRDLLHCRLVWTQDFS